MEYEVKAFSKWNVAISTSAFRKYPSESKQHNFMNSYMFLIYIPLAQSGFKSMVRKASLYAKKYCCIFKNANDLLPKNIYVRILRQVSLK